jgi:galactokinase
MPPTIRFTRDAVLNAAYQLIRREGPGALNARAVAKELGGKVLREVDERAILTNFAHLREHVGDRAILRAWHFFAENHRVREQTAALNAGDVDRFLANVKSSGHSSFEYLQNLYSPAHSQDQGLPLALCLAERFLQGKRGAARVHGGGFAGTVQILVEKEHAQALCTLMNSAFGADACHLLRIRQQGAAIIE